MQTIGVAIIVKDERETIRECIESFAEHVDQIIVAVQNDTSEETLKLIKESSPKVEIYNYGDWTDDFAAKRNFSFSFLNTDWALWCDSDDIIYQPELMREMVDKMPDEIGGIWFPYHYSQDEFGNVNTIYVRERLLRRKYQWVWQSAVHETVTSLLPCKFAKDDNVIIVHKHKGKVDRGTRNFRILYKMLKTEPGNKRVWLYLGHQHFAAQEFAKASEWYVKFGQDTGALPLERYQALCYCSKALREMRDKQCVDVALAAFELFPNFKDAVLELAHSYLRLGDFDKAIHYAMLSDIKQMVEPPNIIFINPMEYTFNKYALLSECYLKKGDLRDALEWMQRATSVRPTVECKNNILAIESLIQQQRITDSIKTLAVHLIENQELIKLQALVQSTPYWFRETPEFQQLSQGVNHYTKDIESKPEIVENEKEVTVNIGNALNLESLLKDLDSKYDKIKLISPFPSGTKIINVLSQSDIERLIVTSDNRHIKELRVEEKRIVCTYDHQPPKGLLIKMFLGRGLEYWSPKTIIDVGCGGSETAMSKYAENLSKLDNQVILYAMDNQVWDGVLYRSFDKFNPDGSSCDLFISSRVPEVFDSPIKASQKWLWMHDIHCGDRLTPERVSELDVIVVLSHWHCDHIKRVYPFLRDCEVIDLDEQKKTYEDTWTAGVFYEDAKIARLPKIAIIGNGIDVDRFNSNLSRNPRRFIYCSSPDRGLEQILEMWPLIKAKLPDAELKIFYGWEYFDSSLFLESQRVLKEKIRFLIKQDGIQWCGRIGQEYLAKELQQAGVMLYPPPHDFRETYGIAFLEAQAAGVICFYRQNGALGETIGERGIPLFLDSIYKQTVNIIVETLQNSELCAKIRESAKTYAQSRSWRGQSEKIIKLWEKLNE